MKRTKSLSWLSLIVFLSACASYRAAGQVQSGRQALLISDSDRALAYFQQAAQSNPDYIYESGLFREGVWTYVGRAQYNLGKFNEARQSLERALSLYKDDYLARLYLGLALARSGDSRGFKEIESGMRGLHDWLEYINSSRPFTSFWDPLREIRSAIEKALATSSGKDMDAEKLISTAEWVGYRMEDEIDRVRRDERRQFRDRDFPRRGLSIGVDIGF
jgi:tetratricopeptide (TPR) repeat protein